MAAQLTCQPLSLLPVYNAVVYADPEHRLHQRQSAHTNCQPDIGQHSQSLADKPITYDKLHSHQKLCDIVFMQSVF